MAPPGTVAMLGFDENKQEDLLQQHLQAAAETKWQIFSAAYAFVDAMLREIQRQVDHPSGPVLAEPGMPSADHGVQCADKTEAGCCEAARAHWRHNVILDKARERAQWLGQRSEGMP